MRPNISRSFFAALLVFCCFPVIAEAQLVREKGAIYLEDFLGPGDEILLKTTHPAPIYYQLDGQRRLGTLKVGEPALVLAVSDKAYKVQTQATHALVKGWISFKALEEHDHEKLVKTAEQLHERQLVVQDLIDKKQVALGMTESEVRASLGDPDRINSEINQQGKSAQLEYITYDNIPQYITRFDQFGRAYQDVVFVKVETGKVSINLEDDIVKSIENTEGAPNLQARITVAPPPVFLF